MHFFLNKYECSNLSLSVIIRQLETYLSSVIVTRAKNNKVPQNYFKLLISTPVLNGHILK